MKWLIALLALCAAPAWAETRTLFIGIDEYAYSAGKPGNRDPQFRDLSGAVNDVLRIRAVLAGPRWRLALDDFRRDSGCAARNAVSVTITNECATSAAILRELSGQIMASAAGDTLLVFFAGHGSQSFDRLRSEASGNDSTLVPHDARGGTVSDILDNDIDRLIAAANARGVNVVTVFDSCHAGSATRDLRGGAPRLAPMAEAQPAAGLAIPPPIAGVPRGYRTHLSAAADGETAREVTVDGERGGVFSRALAAALAELPAPAYADIAAEIRNRLIASGDRQTPGAEGALAVPFLGLAPPPARIFAADVADGGLRIAGGSLAGVTPGSSYGVHANIGAAARGDAPLAIGTIAEAGFGDARLALAAPLSGSSARLAVREIEHVYGAAGVPLRIDGGGAAQRAAVLAALAPVGALRIGAADAAYVFEIAGDAVQLRAGDGTAIGSALPASDAAAIGETGRKLAQYFALLTLRNDRGAAAGSLAMSFDCVEGNPALAQANGEAVAHVGDILTATFKNQTEGKRWPTLLALGDGLGIGVLRTEALALQPGDLLRKRGIGAPVPGRNRLLLLLTDAPIDLSAMEQSGARSVVPRNALERLLRDAALGQNSRTVARVGEWEAQLVTINILPASQRRGGPPCPFRLRQP